MEKVGASIGGFIVAAIVLGIENFLHIPGLIVAIILAVLSIFMIFTGTTESKFSGVIMFVMVVGGSVWIQFK